MQCTKMLRIILLTTILSFVLVVTPSVPALAVREIELIPSQGQIGETFYVEGNSFPSIRCTSCGDCFGCKVKIYFSHDKADKGDELNDEVTTYEVLSSAVKVGDDGEFREKAQVPSALTGGYGDEEINSGIYYIYVTDVGSNEIRAVASFIVIASEIKLGSEDGTVGAEVDINGAYFSADEELIIAYDVEDIAIESGDKETGSDGEFGCSVLIPPSIAGDHTIVVEDETGHKGEARFTVKPEITTTPTSVKVGDEATIMGTGFSDGEKITVTINGTKVATTPTLVETNSVGSFEASFETPNLAAAFYTVEAKDAGDNVAAVEFGIGSSISISPVTTNAAPGHVGMDITITGAGFIADHELTITYASEQNVVATITTNTDGAFTTILKIPQSEAGEHIVTTSDGTNSLTFTFIMESSPPPIPALLLPETNAEVNSSTHFYWEDVTDDSLPVTYTLQVAGDEDFISDSILLEKKGLTDSEYIITEKLDPTTQEAPYYWRVKAIDGASNVSEWSAPESFYVSDLARPQWIVNLWWGLGITGFAFLGYWLGKRAAYRR